MRSTFLLLCLVCCTASALKAQPDTLRSYGKKDRLAHYSDPKATVHAARFITSGRGRITGLTVMLGGSNASGSATVHIYGHEGGLPAPLLGQDLVPPIRIEKTRQGPEQIQVNLSEAVDVANNQFFISVDECSPGVHLLSNRRATRAICSSSTGTYTYQALRRGEGEWRYGKYAYAIDVHFEPAFDQDKVYLKDVSREWNIDTLTVGSSGMAWGDIDGDGLADLLADGRLYLNQRGSALLDITVDRGISGVPRLHAFIDIDNDGNLDILFMGMDTATTGVLYLNEGSGRFQRKSLSVPPIATPSSYSIADANADGYPDIFITQRGQKGATVTRRSQLNYLLLNTQRSGFSAIEPAGDDSPLWNGGATEVQWIDIDLDGRSDLYLSDCGGRDRIWINRGDEGFYDATSTYLESTSTSPTMGSDWCDYNGDGSLDLIRSQRIHPRDVGGERRSGLLLAHADPSASGSQFYRRELSEIEYEHEIAGVTWTDIDNDGRTDILATVGCECRYAELYTQNSSGDFTFQTDHYGLQWVAAGPDAVWIDIDNDGRLDLATMVGEHLRLFLNQSPPANHYIGFDMAAASSGGAVEGTRITVIAKDHQQTRVIGSGRGRMMQGAQRASFGLADAMQVDSVRIEWPTDEGYRVEILTDLAADQMYQLRRGGASAVSGATTAASSVDAFPNPFTTALNFTIDLSEEQHVTLMLYSAVGEQVAVVLNERLRAGSHKTSWTPVDANGKRMPQGTYIYRCTIGTQETTGRMVLQH